MSHDLICAWLGLPAGVWPPDHYCLLGLTPGENDPQLIEERVHERLDTVRRYQMIHPDQATEAMNRIAQAFVCLSEPASKRVYDVALLGAAGQPPASTPTAAVEDRDPLILVYNPTSQETAPPIRLQYDATGQDTAPPIRLQYDATNQETAPPVRRPPLAEIIPEALPVAILIEDPPQAIPVEVIEEAAPAPRALATKRDLYRRIVHARRLSELWNQAGKCLASPKRRLSRLAEFNKLQRVLGDIREKLRSFPPLLGAAGQPGYQVLALEQLTSPPMLQALEPSQREALNNDWQAGQHVLEAYRGDLRQEARALHRRDPLKRLGRALRTTIVEKPGTILVGIAVLTISLSVVRIFVEPLVYQTLENVLSLVKGR